MRNSLILMIPCCSNIFSLLKGDICDAKHSLSWKRVGCDQKLSTCEQRTASRVRPHLKNKNGCSVGIKARLWPSRFSASFVRIIGDYVFGTGLLLWVHFIMRLSNICAFDLITCSHLFLFASQMSEMNIDELCHGFVRGYLGNKAIFSKH